MSIKPLDVDPQLAVARGAGVYVETLITALDGAAERLEAGDDPEALHDFRVILRRLRVWIDAYSPFLRPGRKLTKQLRRLFRRTNVARDLQVQLQWLRKQQDILKPHQRPGLHWLRQWIRDNDSGSTTDIGGRVRAEWPPVRVRLRRRVAAAADGTDALTQTFGEASGEVIESHINAFVKQIEKIHSPADQKRIHRTRVAAKRLRYLIEPFRRKVDGTPAVLKALAALQDLFGGLHDRAVIIDTFEQAIRVATDRHARVLIEAVRDRGADDVQVQRLRRQPEQAGLLVLLDIATADYAGMYKEAEQRYLNDRARALVDAARAVALKTHELHAAPAVVRSH